MECMKFAGQKTGRSFFNVFDAVRPVFSTLISLRFAAIWLELSVFFSAFSLLFFTAFLYRHIFWGMKNTHFQKISVDIIVN